MKKEINSWNKKKISGIVSKQESIPNKDKHIPIILDPKRFLGHNPDKENK